MGPPASQQCVSAAHYKLLNQLTASAPLPDAGGLLADLAVVLRSMWQRMPPQVRCCNSAVQCSAAQSGTCFAVLLRRHYVIGGLLCRGSQHKAFILDHHCRLTSLLPLPARARARSPPCSPWPWCCTALHCSSSLPTSCWMWQLTTWPPTCRSTAPRWGRTACTLWGGSISALWGSSARRYGPAPLAHWRLALQS